MKQSQKQRILNHLMNIGPLTAWEAMRDYGIMQLSARLCELRDEDLITVQSRTIHSKNRFGEPIHYKQYFIDGGKEE